VKITDYLAIWGALVATLVAAWNIYKDFLKRHRVKVSAGFQIIIAGDGSPPVDVFAVTVTNLSDRPTKITHIGGYSDRHYKPKWLDRLICCFVKRSPKAFLFSFIPFSGASLPCQLAPWDKMTFAYTVPADRFPKIETLEVVTADNRRWFCSHKDIAKIHADESYKTAHNPRR
jgi:hypothetical protein